MNTVTLIDGRQVPSDSEEWRHETEARWVTNRPTLMERRLYLDEVQARRGQEEADRLRKTMSRIWEVRKC